MTETQVLTKEELKDILQQGFMWHNYQQKNLLGVSDYIGLTAIEEPYKTQVILEFAEDQTGEDLLRMLRRKYPQLSTLFEQRWEAVIDAIQAHFGYEQISLYTLQRVLEQLSQG
jgi:hypothetical protein